MRHRVAGKKLGRSKDQRVALRRNLVKQLIEHERIQRPRALRRMPFAVRLNA